MCHVVRVALAVIVALVALVALVAPVAPVVAAAVPDAFPAGVTADVPGAVTDVEEEDDSTA